MTYHVCVNLDRGVIEIFNPYGVLIYEAENIVEANRILKELEAV